MCYCEPTQNIHEANRSRAKVDADNRRTREHFSSCHLERKQRKRFMIEGSSDTFRTSWVARAAPIAHGFARAAPLKHSAIRGRPERHPASILRLRSKLDWHFSSQRGCSSCHFEPAAAQRRASSSDVHFEPSVALDQARADKSSKYRHLSRPSKSGI